MKLADTLTNLIAFADCADDARVAYRFRVGPRSGHHDLTFGELRSVVAKKAGALLDGGCRRGERVALLMPHGSELFCTFLACLYGGLVPSVVAWPTAKMDPAKYRRNLLAVVERLAANHLVTDSGSADRLGEVLGQTKVLDPARLAGSVATNPAPIEEGPLLIQFSGGTTGVQKSVPITSAHLRTQLESYGDRLGLTEQDSIITWLPLYHDMGLVACLLLPFVYRLPTTVFAPMEWVMAPRDYLEAVGASRATLAWLPNFAFSFMATRVRADELSLDLSSLRALINCSEPVRAESMDAFFEAFAHAGLRKTALQSCYAMAEATFAVTQSRLDAEPKRLEVSRAELGKGRIVPTSEAARQIVSSGTPIEGMEIRVVGSEGNDAGDDSIGEIWLKGPSVMDDYLAGPHTEPRAAFTGDWYRTGDLGVLVDGELYVTGRKKDVIIVGGVNLFPEDVEHATSSVDRIKAGRCVAMGIEEAHRGTERLVVVAELESLDGVDQERVESEVRAAVTSDCGIAPSLVLLVPPQWIVKSTAGKISRSETRTRVLERWSELTKDARGAFAPAE